MSKDLIRHLGCLFFIDFDRVLDLVDLIKFLFQIDAIARAGDSREDDQHHNDRDRGRFIVLFLRGIFFVLSGLLRGLLCGSIIICRIRNDISPDIHIVPAYFFARRIYILLLIGSEVRIQYAVHRIIVIVIVLNVISVFILFRCSSCRRIPRDRERHDRHQNAPYDVDCDRRAHQVLRMHGHLGFLISDIHIRVRLCTVVHLDLLALKLPLVSGFGDVHDHFFILFSRGDKFFELGKILSALTFRSKDRLVDLIIDLGKIQCAETVRITELLHALGIGRDHDLSAKRDEVVRFFREHEIISLGGRIIFTGP